MFRRVRRLRPIVLTVVVVWFLFTVATSLGLQHSNNRKTNKLGPPGDEEAFAALDDEERRVVVTLATNTTRLRRELLLTLRSLFRQTLPPEEIRVYFPADQRGEVIRPGTPRSFAHEEPSSFRFHMPEELRRKEVRVFFVPDRGPAAKFVHTIQSFVVSALRKTKSSTLMGSETLEDQAILDTPVVVCSDDHFYEEKMLETLFEASTSMPNAALGFRGWRVREDLVWGVDGDEFAWHVVEGYRIAMPYEVGILTANEAYLVRPRFFLNRQSDGRRRNPDYPQPSSIPSYDLGGTPIVTPLEETNAPPEALFVDDVWMSGHLAARDVHRYVVPSTCHSVDMGVNVRRRKLDEFESAMRARGISRGFANTVTLSYFGPVWDRHTWYRFGGANAPAAPGRATAVLRTARGVVLHVSAMWHSVAVELSAVTHTGVRLL